MLYLCCNPPGSSGKNGKPATGARSIAEHFIQPMTPAQKKKHHVRYVIMCCVDMRPFSMAERAGFQYFVGGLNPSYVTETIHKSTMEDILDALAADVRANLMTMLKDHIESCKELGWGGPFFGVQSDLTSTHGIEFCTLTVSFIPRGHTEMERLTLTTKAFPGTHTASDVDPWIRKVRHVLLQFTPLILFFIFICPGVFFERVAELLGATKEAAGYKGLPFFIFL